MTRHLPLAAGLVVLTAAGCVSSLDQAKARDADKTLPEQFRPETPVVELDDKTVTTAAQKHWNTFFADPALRVLIREALHTNQEMGIRLQEVIIARNETSARRGEILPSVSAGGGLGLEKVGEYTSQGVADEANGVPAHLPNIQAGLLASWEVDLWGKLRDAANAANERTVAANEAQRLLATEIVAEIALSYYELVVVDVQLGVLDANLKIQRDAYEVVKIKKAAGRATELAVQKFNAEILGNQAHRFELEQERQLIENRINLVIGRYPQPILTNSYAFAQWAPASVTTGPPTELLNNRPDVRQAEHVLQAARLDVDVARKRFYPSLSLDFRIGYEAFNPLHLIATPASLMYDAAGSLMVPLLNRAAITADYRAANAMQIQAVLEYERTLLTAYTEVANQLITIDKLQQRYALQAEQVAALKQAIEVSNLLYRSARADYQEVLLTRRDAIEAEMELVETRGQQMKAQVALYQALGGGWRPSKATEAQQPSVASFAGESPCSEAAQRRGTCHL
jgi:multidrug efflux system outer membrane protein